MFPKGMEGRGRKSLSMEMKHALSRLSKAPMVDQGDGKGKELGRHARTYVAAAKGGRVGSRVALQGGTGHSSQNGEKDKRHWVARECYVVESVGRNSVPEKDSGGLFGICIVESEGRRVLFGLEDELRCLKKSVEDLLGKVDCD